MILFDILFLFEIFPIEILQTISFYFFFLVTKIQIFNAEIGFTDFFLTQEFFFSLEVGIFNCLDWQRWRYIRRCYSQCVFSARISAYGSWIRAWKKP